MQAGDGPKVAVQAGPEVPGLPELLVAFFERSREAILLTRPDGTVLRANPAACALLQLTEAQLVARGRAGLVVSSPELAVALEARKQRGHSVIEAAVRRGDGSVFQAELASSLLAEGFASVTIRDLSVPRRAEAALHEATARAELSEQGLRALAAQVSDVIWTLDLASGRFTYVSPSIQGLRGLTPEEAMAEPVEQSLTPESLARVRATMALIGTPQESDPHLGLYDQPHKDGSIRHVEITTTYLRDTAGRPVAALGISRDATARVRAERALQEREAELRVRLAQLDERDRWLQASQRVARLGHYVLDLPTDRWTASEVLVELLGLERGGALGTADFFALVHPEDRGRVVASWEALVAQGDHFSLEYRVGPPGGPARWVHGLGDLRRDAQGRPLQLVGTIQDITPRKEAERAREALAEQLREAHKLESVGRLAGGVAHDFNNILVVILTCGGEIRERLQAGQLPVKADVDELLVAAERARDLTRQLLAFARRQVVAPVPLDLNLAVREAARLLERLLGEAVELSLSLQKDLWGITCDPGQLQQVLLNLAVNARDAMPAGGHLRIRTSNAAQAPGDAADWHGPPLPPGPLVRLAVEDDGAGIPEEAWPRLFEPFFTTKGPGRGTGLGLATVYGIVQQAGACIRFRSRQGRGTTFEIWWPRTEGPAPAASPGEASPGPAASRAGLVLLVEDDDPVREAASRSLRAAGYEVLAASGGEAALALLARAGAPPDLLLTDVVMPGMNGREVAEVVRRACPGLPVLFMSGYAQDILAPGEPPAGRHPSGGLPAVPAAGAQERALETGVDLLEKPFTGAVLVRRVASALERSRAAAGPPREGA